METEATPGVGAVVAANAGAVANPLSVLSVAKIVLTDGLFAAPTVNDGTKIAKELAKVYYPIKLGVATIPGKLAVLLDAAGADTEEMLPLATLKAKILVNKMTRGLGARSVDSNDVLDMILPAAVAKQTQFIAQFEALVSKIADDLDALREQYAGPKAFYAANSTGRRMPIDVAAVQTILLNAVQSLNVLASGYNGYEVLALVNYVSEIGKLLSDKDLQIPGCANQTQLFNKVGFRMLPVHAAAHKAIVEFVDYIELANDPELNADKCYEILIAAMNVKRQMEQATDLGAQTALGVKKKLVAAAETPTGGNTYTEVAVQTREYPAKAADRHLVSPLDEISIDPDQCVKCGRCCQLAPEAFIPAFAGGTIVAVMVEKAGFRENVELAFDECPEEAIDYCWAE